MCRSASGSGCVCVRRAATARRISLGGEATALYPFSSLICRTHAQCISTQMRQRHCYTTCAPRTKRFIITLTAAIK